MNLDEVAIADEQSHHIVRVPLYPSDDVPEIVFRGARVEKVARGMAEIHGSIDQMCLTCKHAYAIVELVKDIQGLIRCSVVGSYEGTIVCCDLCDVAILAVTEFGIIVAGLCICRLRRR